MIWASIRDHMEGDMTPLAVIPSSSVGYLRVLLAWYSIQRPDKILMMWIREEKKQTNMSAQITLKEALKVWRLLQF